MTNPKYEVDCFARLVQHVGDDRSILAAAKVSTQGVVSEHAFAEDVSTGLISYLMRNRHGSPFEHNSMTFLVEAPIFVAREFMRHRIGFSYNEESGRYTELRPRFYLPGPSRPLAQVGRPGQYEFVPLPEDVHRKLVQKIKDQSWDAYCEYLSLLNAGAAKEVARMVLPVNIFTSFYVTCNARSLMSFLSLRTNEPESAYPSKPQWEIEQVARKMESMFGQHFPVTYEAFLAGKRVAP